MNDGDAEIRIAEFLAELREDIVQFQDCENIEINSRGSWGDTPLKIAVVRCDVQMVADLLNAGADPNITGEDDCAPLHHAASRGHCEIIRMLLAHGAKTDIVSMLGTPAELARRSLHVDAYVLLVRKDR